MQRLCRVTSLRLCEDLDDVGTAGQMNELMILLYVGRNSDDGGCAGAQLAAGRERAKQHRRTLYKPECSMDVV